VRLEENDVPDEVRRETAGALAAPHHHIAVLQANGAVDRADQGGLRWSLSAATEQARLLRASRRIGEVDPEDWSELRANKQPAEAVAGKRCPQRSHSSRPRTRTSAKHRGHTGTAADMASSAHAALMPLRSSPQAHATIY